MHYCVYVPNSFLCQVCLWGFIHHSQDIQKPLHYNKLIRLVDQELYQKILYPAIMHDPLTIETTHILHAT